MEGRRGWCPSFLLHWSICPLQCDSLRVFHYWSTARWFARGFETHRRNQKFDDEGCTVLGQWQRSMYWWDTISKLSHAKQVMQIHSQTTDQKHSDELVLPPRAKVCLPDRPYRHDHDDEIQKKAHHRHHCVIFLPVKTVTLNWLIPRVSDRRALKDGNEYWTDSITYHEEHNYVAGHAKSRILRKYVTVKKQNCKSYTSSYEGIEQGLYI